MPFAVGALVKVRGREWVVLPESEHDLLMLRPLGGTEEEVTGICLALEQVEPATFALPDPSRPGDYRSSRLLRDALRLGFRSSAGPFRSFANLAVEPRPYQLVPLLLALKLQPVRMLIADDVGIGKTIEACLVLRELLDRGEVRRFAVLCPPHLAEQWQAELHDKFHLDAELVLASTAARLERHCGAGQSLFDLYPYVIVSMDFIKSDSRRDEFLRTCPELVIVDEAHSCASAGQGARHQRHLLISRLAQNQARHMILVTATPHAGNEEAFRSLLAFLSPEFKNLPEDLTGKENEQHRRKLAAHFVQRRRADIRRYLDADTPFPEREDAEEGYRLSADYKQLFNRVLAYAREIVADTSGAPHHQRVRWWSALALLRSLASSPAAAAATLRSRAGQAEAGSTADVNEIGRRLVLDLGDGEGNEVSDAAPGSDLSDPDDEQSISRRTLNKMALEADALHGEKDDKLAKAVKLIKKLLDEGYRPIVFCRFIPTAEYVAAELRQRLKGVEVAAVTGTLPHAEREERVIQLSAAPKRVLVCTDCLSEGINLQHAFDAVFHYDLSWNPTRHEQREGRVDRYGQGRDKVRVVTYYGLDNQIDGIVLDVLLRKHKSIRSSLGISVPVPVDTDQIVEAIFEGLLLRGKDKRAAVTSEVLPGMDAYLKPRKDDLFARWDQTTAKEKRSHTLFAQETIKVEEVAQELAAVQAAIGSGVNVAAFVRSCLELHRAAVSGDGTLLVDLSETPLALRERMGLPSLQFKAGFALPVPDRVMYLGRTHPAVEGLASFVLDTALDPILPAEASRCGVVRTAGVERRTTLLLVRYRFHVVMRRGEVERPLLAEDCRLLAFAGSPRSAEWLPDPVPERLLSLAPTANVSLEQATTFLEEAIGDLAAVAPAIEADARRRGEELLAAHQRVRAAANLAGVRYRVEPQLPPDILGLYIFLPDRR